MNVLKNIERMNLSEQISEEKFIHAVFVKEEINADKIRYYFSLPTVNSSFSVDISVKKEHTIQFMTGASNDFLIEEMDGKVEDVLEWFYTQFYKHAIFCLPLVTNKLKFKFVKVQGNVLYHHRLPFLKKRNSLGE